MLVLSARDFGAKGDGRTDDTAALQAALDAAEAAGGAVVHLEAGTYIVTGRGKASSGCLQIGSNVVLAGDGQGDTVIKLADGSSGDITGIIRTPSSQVTANVTIRDLTIDGNSDRTSGLVDGIFTGVAPGADAASHDILIASVEVRNVSRYAFDPHEQTKRLVVIDSTAHDSGKDGFTLDYIVDSVIAGNASRDNGRHGFNLVTSSHDVLLANNDASGNASVGLVVQNGSEERAWVDDVLIAGGSFHDNALQGVLIKLSSDVTLAGAEIYGNGKDGVMVHGATGARIVDSEIYDNSVVNPGHYDGIRLLDYRYGSYANTTGSLWPVEDTTVRGNTIYNSADTLMEDGVSLEADGSRTVRLGDNTFDNLAGADLNLGEATVKGAAGDPAPVGTAGMDRLVGTGSDNRFEGEAGNDFIDGGGGTDEAAYAGTLDRYHVIFLSDGSLIVRDRGDPSGGDGIDVVANVERLVFDGTAFAVSDLRVRDKSFTFAFFDFRGGEGDDVFIGSVEADILDGGEGRDTLVGGDGDDLYAVDDAADRVVERAGGGVDTVGASVNTTLSDNVEHLDLSGTAFSGRGNGLDNRVTGTAGANELKGYTGDDILDGKGGNDRLYGYEDDDELDGGDGNDEINAGDGDDDIDGGDGADIMRGGSGDDRYGVDDSGDEVVEYNGAGSDTVTASIDYALPQKVETLILVGTAMNGVGNALDNDIFGNALNNLIDGGLGNDRMEGGRGNDTYVVDSTRDVITEFSSGGKGGIDSVVAGVSFILPDHVENLSLTGTGHLGSTGNSRANRIEGNDASNRLSGLGGDDRLTGNGGPDVFAFSGGGRDVVRDLDPDEDKLDLRDTTIASRADLMSASTSKGGNVVIDLKAGGSITLLGTSLTDLESVGLILA